MKGIHLTLVLALAACAGTDEKAPGSDESHVRHDGHVKSQPGERDLFTRTSEIVIDKAVVGYLVEYQPLPAGSRIERDLPTGSYLIEGRKFDLIGVISPSGDVRRISKSGSESIGVWNLEEGLKRFFGSSTRVELRELRTSPPPKPPAPKEGEGKGDEKKEGEEGGAKKDEPTGGK